MSNRHCLTLLVSVTDFEAVVQVKCAAGCGHPIYSDRGRVVCPCHWPAAAVARVGRTLGHCGVGVVEGDEEVGVTGPGAVAQPWDVGYSYGKWSNFAEDFSGYRVQELADFDGKLVLFVVDWPFC